jgi:HEAT repeat protein
VSLLVLGQTISFEAALRDLAGGSPRARAAAASALGDVVESAARAQAVPALIGALRDDRAEVRAEAALALGDLESPDAVEPLAGRLADMEPTVRQAAAIALGKLGHAGGFAPLAEALREGPPDLRFQAVTSLAEIDGPRSYDPIVAALGDGDAQVVSAAALALGAIGDGRASGHLARLLERGDPQVRFDAAYALAQLGDGRGQTDLERGLSGEPTAWDAVEALERLGPAAAAPLAGALGNKRLPPEARLRAAAAILRLPATDAAAADAAQRVLLEGLKLRKLPLRGLAVDLLRDLAPAWAALPLRTLAASRAGRELQEEIADALRRIGG